MNNWSERPTIILGSGPSLDDEQIKLVKSAHERDYCQVLCVNDTWRLVRSANALYAADLRWWSTYAEPVQASFQGQLWTWDQAVKSIIPTMNIVASQIGFGAPVEDEYITLGSNSGLQALQLAYLWNSPLTLLLGFDAWGVRGSQHWFGEHPAPLDQGYLQYEVWHQEANILARELLANNFQIINCSPNTAYRCFPKMSLADALTILIGFSG